MSEFDDARLDDPVALAEADDLLRELAGAGARLRTEVGAAEASWSRLAPDDRPRAVIAVGPEARLLRAVLEPTSPVPFVAWSNLTLPGWVGPLDVVVVLGGEGPTPRACVVEALRRGCRVILTAQPDSELAHLGQSRLTTLLPSTTTDPLCRAIVAIESLHRLGLTGSVQAAAIADALDAVALGCGHGVDLAKNPAKELALLLADTEPLVWGGSVLAARASRRIAEAVRTATGQVALAADAAELVPLLAATPPRDPFLDPMEAGVVRRPSVLVIDDGQADAAAREAESVLLHNAEGVDVRVGELRCTEGPDLVRYATVLQQGRFAAAYLAVGLGGRRG